MQPSTSLVLSPTCDLQPFVILTDDDQVCTRGQCHNQPLLPVHVSLHEGGQAWQVLLLCPRRATGEGEDGTTTITLPGDLFANYPHTMWDRDADGNKIAVQVIKQESASGHDLLSHAIKSEETNENGHVDIQTITIPGSVQQSTANVPSAAATQVIVGTSNGGMHNGSGTIVLQPSANPRVIVADDAPVPRGPSNPKQNGGTEDRPHVCDICNKGFVKREHLTKHLRIHKSDNKRYSCEYCQKAFRDRYELVRHTRRHTGDFPFR